MTATNLAFVTQPAGATSGAALPNFTVQVEDMANNPVAASGVTVTVTLNQNTFSTGVNTATATTNGGGAGHLQQPSH